MKIRKSGKNALKGLARRRADGYLRGNAGNFYLFHYIGKRGQLSGALDSATVLTERFTDFYENDLKTEDTQGTKYDRFSLFSYAVVGNRQLLGAAVFIWAEQIGRQHKNITTFLMIFLMFTMSLKFIIRKSSLKINRNTPERLFK